jgi:hypothetical protein
MEDTEDAEDVGHCLHHARNDDHPAVNLSMQDCLRDVGESGQTKNNGK